MAEENLRGLPPEERIKRLKELERKKKQEIEEAARLIQESEVEITETRKLKEKVPIPEVAKEDTEGLSKEGKDVLKAVKTLPAKKKDLAETVVETADTQPAAESLEETLERERPNIPPALLNTDYALQLSQQPMQTLYQEMTTMYEAARERGYLNNEEQRRVAYLTAGVEAKLDAASNGAYPLTRDAAEKALVTQRLAAHLLSDPHSSYHPQRDLYK